VPAVIADPGYHAAKRFLEFFSMGSIPDEAELRQERDAMPTNTAERTVAEEKHQRATEELTTAKSLLISGSPEAMDQLLQDMATAAKPMTKAGLQSIVEQVRVDAYAQFIRRLITYL
jgi:hypothetical protein